MRDFLMTYLDQKHIKAFLVKIIQGEVNLRDEWDIMLKAGLLLPPKAEASAESQSSPSSPSPRTHTRRRKNTTPPSSTPSAE